MFNYIGNRMSSKKPGSSGKRSFVRYKEAKINAILDSTRVLIETKGYEKVTIRDISASAGVSLGLIYTYYPGGKPEILTRIGEQYAWKMLGPVQPGGVDYGDFPGFLRSMSQNMIDYTRSNRKFVKALSLAPLFDDKAFEGFPEPNDEFKKAIVGFFNQFRGVTIGDDQWLFIVKWAEIFKAIMLHCTLYPSPFKTDGELIDEVVDISLHMFGYDERTR